MQRVFDFSPAEHDVIVSRILVQLHQAVDGAFPQARPASHRFAKTAFVGSDEPTLTQLVPNEALREAALSGEHNSTSTENPSRYARSRLKEQSEEQPLSEDEAIKPQNSWWRFADNIPLKQTLIGILSIILVVLAAYLLFSP